MKIALCQINTTVGDFSGNVESILAFAKRAKEARCAIAVFPELTLTGYPPRDLLERPGFARKAEEALSDLVKRLPKDLAVFIGTILPNTGRGNHFFNAVALIENGLVRETRRKTLLPNYDVFDEDRWFEPCPQPEPPIQVAGLSVGVTLCEDLWNHPIGLPKSLYDRDPVADLARNKLDLLINLSASPFHHAKLSVREEVARQAVLKSGAPTLYCNLVGGNDELVFDGCSLALDSKGCVTARGKAFEEDLLVVDYPSLAGPVASVSGETEGLYRALVLGLHDYVTKCGFKQALIGLSGGIDSCLVAALAVEALGAENVLGVTMPSPYSSRGSVDDSEALAHNLGIRFLNIPLTPMFHSSLDTLTPFFEGKPADLTEENVQARLRGVLLMALSNKFNRLVLSTGNKSEMSMGYCTLYGDMCGGLAVISDLLKTQVYELSRYANRHRLVIPESVFTKAPSAELRPNQKDQDSLPPYDVLDAVLKRIIEDNLNPDDIVREGFDRAVVSRVARALDLSEYKRRQMAPGLKVTPKAFGVGRRVPVAQKYREDL
jgi:NAD+ synthase/NAD+ synthase (glutamine-hydrolysing)